MVAEPPALVKVGHARTAWGEFMTWIAAEGHTPVPDLWACYVAGPESGPDPAAFRTELTRPLLR